MTSSRTGCSSSLASAEHEKLCSKAPRNPAGLSPQRREEAGCFEHKARVPVSGRNLEALVLRLRIGEAHGSAVCDLDSNHSVIRIVRPCPRRRRHLHARRCHRPRERASDDARKRRTAPAKKRAARGLGDLPPQIASASPASIDAPAIAALSDAAAASATREETAQKLSQLPSRPRL